MARPLRFSVVRVDACATDWVPHDFKAMLAESAHGANAVVCVTGTDDDGIAVTAYLCGLLPHFYVEAPPQLTAEQLPALREYLAEAGEIPVRALHLEPAVAVRNPGKYEPLARPLLRVTPQRAADIARLRLLWLTPAHETGFRWQSMQFTPRAWQADEELNDGIGADVRTVRDVRVTLPAGKYAALRHDAQNIIACADHSDLAVDAPPERTEPLPAPHAPFDRDVACLYDSLSTVADAAGVVCLLERILRAHLPSVDVTDRLFSPSRPPAPPREQDDRRFGRAPPSAEEVARAKAAARQKKAADAMLAVKPRPWAGRSLAERRGAPRGQPALSFAAAAGAKRGADDAAIE
jgi:hypothetical protein